MQQIKPVQTIQPVGIGQLPAPEKPQNKPIYPIKPEQPINKTLPYEGQNASMMGNVDKAGFGFDGSTTGGLMGKAQQMTTSSQSAPSPSTTNQVPVNQVPQKPGTQPTGGLENSATTPTNATGTQSIDNSQYAVTAPTPVQNTFKPNEYNSVGTNGVTSDKQYQYDPRKESLVQNQITGLLDPNSDIMRKAIANAQGYNAARGLQSSSIGNEVALSSMIDKALPIAQQDAQTYNQAQSQQWQTQAQQDQLNQKNQQDAAMADKQGAINNQLQNNQMGWQTGEKNTDRQFQAQLEDLKYKQQLGTLDKQQSLQLVQMERSAQIQTERDAVLQKYSVQLNELQNDQRWKELNAQIEANFKSQALGFDQQTKMEYGNAQSTAINAAMQAIGMAMSNPNMTAEQQKAAVSNIMTSLQNQASMLAVIYGASDGQMPPKPIVTPPPATGNTGGTGSTGGTGGGGSTGGGTGGGSSGGGGTGNDDRYNQQMR
ncbi:hypothetical protein [Shewanella cutis]|uniref:Uncharacterized protein n=1 Tax=Shewanella cutis TaxID=2766780 RepID=A0ABS9QWB6_9GAMM|nr:hypothetical protein [Shewanella sp. PS-2]MCG9964626.1 hypothetical protein [Shewanella sp. PS-2]